MSKVNETFRSEIDIFRRELRHIGGTKIPGWQVLDWLGCREISDETLGQVEQVLRDGACRIKLIHLPHDGKGGSVLAYRLNDGAEFASPEIQEQIAEPKRARRLRLRKAKEAQAAAATQKVIKTENGQIVLPNTDKPVKLKLPSHLLKRSKTAA